MKQQTYTPQKTEKPKEREKKKKEKEKITSKYGGRRSAEKKEKLLSPILIHRLRGAGLVDAAKEGSLVLPRDTIPVVIKLAKSLPNSRRGSAPRVSF